MQATTKKMFSRTCLALFCILALGGCKQRPAGEIAFYTPVPHPIATHNASDENNTVREPKILTPVPQVTASAFVSNDNPLATASDAGIEICVMDVGQADCTLVMCEGESMLIDCGNKEDGGMVVKQLKEKGVSEIKYLILTHPHEDHIGAAAQIIYNYTIKNAIVSPCEYDTSAFYRTEKALESMQVNEVIPAVGDQYSLGSATFTILAPLNKQYDNINNYSIGIILQYGTFRYLTAGDAQSESESEMVQGSINIAADVLKADHHGSYTSNTMPFLASVSPKSVIITCDAFNSDDNLPNNAVLSRFDLLGCKTYRTDNNGTITVYSDGNNYSIASDR